MPQDHLQDGITYRTAENKSIHSKKFLNWESISTRADQNIYKFTLDNEIPNHPIRDYFAKHLEIYVKVKVIERFMQIEDVFFNFQDLFFLCTYPLNIIYIDV